MCYNQLFSPRPDIRSNLSIAHHRLEPAARRRENLNKHVVCKSPQNGECRSKYCNGGASFEDENTRLIWLVTRHAPKSAPAQLTERVTVGQKFVELVTRPRRLLLIVDGPADCGGPFIIRRHPHDAPNPRRRYPSASPPPPSPDVVSSPKISAVVLVSFHFFPGRPRALLLTRGGL